MWEINAVIKSKDSNYHGVLSDQREAPTASNLSEYTVQLKLKGNTSVPLYFTGTEFESVSLGSKKC